VKEMHKMPHIKKAGRWLKCKEDGLYYWAEQNNLSETGYRLILPQDVENVSREVSFPILFADTVPYGFHKTKKVWYKQTATAKIKDDVSQNIWITYEPKAKAYFLRDLDELGFTIKLMLFSTDILSFEVTEPEELKDISELKRLAKETSYIFGSITLDANNNISEYVQEV
jgi:hypothetical protein